MAVILSIQSHVAYGYVGNRVATFALQRLGHNVITINTVQFSNHTGYGTWQGDIFSAEHIASIWAGIKARISLSQIDAVLTGYLGDEKLGALTQSIVKEIKQENPNLLYCLDPVFGDVGRGIFVPPSLADFFKTRLIQNANILTPNHFEFNYLTQQDNQTITQVKASASPLMATGIQAILVTSYQGEEIEADNIGMLLLTKEETWLIKTPKLDFPIAPNGSGDLVSCLMLDKALQNLPPAQALELTAQQIYGVFTKTKTLKQRELALIPAQNCLTNTHSEFIAKQI